MHLNNKLLISFVIFIIIFTTLRSKNTLKYESVNSIEIENNLYPRLWSCLLSKTNNEYNNSFKSQQHEDKFFFKTFFKNKLNGIYIEMGALDGITFSNTYFFENYLGWSGLLIEGGYDNCMNLINNQNRRPRSQIICTVICKNKYTKFREKFAVGGISEDLPSTWFGIENVKPIIVKCSNLKNILHIHKITHIDFFSLDVEGGELNVLETFDFNILVHYWIIENSKKKENNNEKVRKLLFDNGYIHCSVKRIGGNECWEYKEYDDRVKHLIKKENNYRSNFGYKCY